jgi:hypothetical protein
MTVICGVILEWDPVLIYYSSTLYSAVESELLRNLRINRKSSVFLNCRRRFLAMFLLQETKCDKTRSQRCNMKLQWL